MKKKIIIVNNIKLTNFLEEKKLITIIVDFQSITNKELIIKIIWIYEYIKYVNKQFFYWIKQQLALYLNLKF